MSICVYLVCPILSVCVHFPPTPQRTARDSSSNGRPFSSIPACATESLKQGPNHNERLNAFALPFLVKDEHPSPSWPPPPDTTTTSALNKPNSKEFSSSQGLQKVHTWLHHHDSLLYKTVSFLAPLLVPPPPPPPPLRDFRLRLWLAVRHTRAACVPGKKDGGRAQRNEEGVGGGCCGNPSSNG